MASGKDSIDIMRASGVLPGEENRCMPKPAIQVTTEPSDKSPPLETRSSSIIDQAALRQIVEGRTAAQRPDEIFLEIRSLLRGREPNLSDESVRMMAATAVSELNIDKARQRAGKLLANYRAARDSVPPGIPPDAREKMAAQASASQHEAEAKSRILRYSGYFRQISEAMPADIPETAARRIAAFACVAEGSQEAMRQAGDYISNYRSIVNSLKATRANNVRLPPEVAEAIAAKTCAGVNEQKMRTRITLHHLQYIEAHKRFTNRGIDDTTATDLACKACLSDSREAFRSNVQAMADSVTGKMTFANQKEVSSDRKIRRHRKAKKDHLARQIQPKPKISPKTSPRTDKALPAKKRRPAETVKPHPVKTDNSGVVKTGTQPGTQGQGPTDGTSVRKTGRRIVDLDKEASLLIPKLPLPAKHHPAKLAASCLELAGLFEAEGNTEDARYFRDQAETEWQFFKGHVVDKLLARKLASERVPQALMDVWAVLTPEYHKELHRTRQFFRGMDHKALEELLEANRQAVLAGDHDGRSWQKGNLSGGEVEGILIDLQDYVLQRKSQRGFIGVYPDKAARAVYANGFKNLAKRSSTIGANILYGGATFGAADVVSNWILGRDNLPFPEFIMNYAALSIGGGMGRMATRAITSNRFAGRFFPLMASFASADFAMTGKIDLVSLKVNMLNSIIASGITSSLGFGISKLALAKKVLVLLKLAKVASVAAAPESLGRTLPGAFLAQVAEFAIFKLIAQAEDFE